MLTLLKKTESEVSAVSTVSSSTQLGRAKLRRWKFRLPSEPCNPGRPYGTHKHPPAQGHSTRLAQLRSLSRGQQQPQNRQRSTVTFSDSLIIDSNPDFSFKQIGQKPKMCLSDTWCVYLSWNAVKYTKCQGQRLSMPKTNRNVRNVRSTIPNLKPMTYSCNL